MRPRAPSGEGGITFRARQLITVNRMPAYTATALEKFCVDALVHYGLSTHDASVVTHSLIEAELHGVGPHGMPHLLLYVKKLRDGEAKAKPQIVVQRLGPSLSRLDGDRCLGQIAAARSVEIAEESATATGIGMCLATNTHTYGFAAHYIRALAERGYFAASWCNTTPLMAPSGGHIPLIGTNPIAMAVPAGKCAPILLDMACSTRSWGDIVEAARVGKEIPEGWALDREGKPTRNAQDALDGSLLPFGGYKGYGLALIIEIMTGYLAGLAATEIIPQAKEFRRTPLRSHVMLALDIRRFADIDFFRKQIDDLVDQIARTAPGCGTPRVPGAHSAQRRSENLLRGITLDTTLAGELRSLGEEIGTPFPAGSVK